MEKGREREGEREGERERERKRELGWRWWRRGGCGVKCARVCGRGGRVVVEGIRVDGSCLTVSKQVAFVSLVYSHESMCFLLICFCSGPLVKLSPHEKRGGRVSPKGEHRFTSHQGKHVGGIWTAQALLWYPFFAWELHCGEGVGVWVWVCGCGCVCVGWCVCGRGGSVGGWVGVGVHVVALENAHSGSPLLSCDVCHEPKSTSGAECTESTIHIYVGFCSGPSGVFMVQISWKVLADQLMTHGLWKALAVLTEKIPWCSDVVGKRRIWEMTEQRRSRFET